MSAMRLVVAACLVSALAACSIGASLHTDTYVVEPPLPAPPGACNLACVRDVADGKRLRAAPAFWATCYHPDG